MKKVIIINILLFSFVLHASNKIKEVIKDKDLFEGQKQQYKNLQDKSNEKIPFFNVPKPQLLKSDDKRCFFINHINTDSITLLSSLEKEKILEKYLNKCNTLVDLKNSINELTSLYIDKGYITSKVYLKSQNIKDGKIELFAIEGKLEKFLNNKINTITAFGNLEGKYLNLRDLEVGIENINRLNSNNAKIKLEPSEKIGYSKVSIENKTSNRLNGYISLNNYGEEITGKQQLSLNLNLDNPLTLNDQFKINYNTTDNHNTPENSIGDIYSYSIPFGRSLISLDYSNSEYNQFIKAQFNRYKILGESKNFNLKLKYKWFHNQNHSFSNLIFLNHYRTKKFIEGYKIVNSSYNLSKAGLSFNYIYQIPTFYALASFEYTKGIHLINSLNPTTLDERYKKYTFDLSLVKSFYSFSYNLDFHLQHTKDKLFSINQISIGGPYSVRGYKEEGLSGNKGFYYRNELVYNYPKKILGYFQPSFYIALDGGWVKKEEDSSGGTLVGEAIGTKFNIKNILVDIYYSKALKVSNVLNNKNFLAFQVIYKF